MNDPDISVVLPVFNAEPYLERCIASLLAQDMPRVNYELLFVDNGSTDRSRQILANHASQVRVLDEHRRGAYAARNRALLEAQGSAILFTDPDCVVAPDWLSVAWQQLQSPGVEVVLGRVSPPPGSDALRLIHLYMHHRDTLIFNGEDPTLYFGFTNNLAARREAIDRHTPFDERARGSDTIFVQQVIEASGPGAVCYGPDMRVTHLEVQTYCDFLRKSYLYGRSWRRYRQVVRSRPANTRERRLVWCNTMKHEQLSWFEQARMSLALGGGAAAFKYGAWTCRQSDKAPPSPVITHTEKGNPTRHAK